MREWINAINAYEEKRRRGNDKKHEEKRVDDGKFQKIIRLHSQKKQTSYKYDGK